MVRRFLRTPVPDSVLHKVLQAYEVYNIWLQVARIDMVKIKEFSIVLFGTEVYNPGSLIEGYVVLELSAPQNCKCISIVISGKAISGIGSDSTEISLIPIARSGIQLLGNDGRDSQPVGAGRHEFPFSFQLPRSLPSSYEGKLHPASFGRTYRIGSISYSLTAVLSRPWSFKRYVVRTITVKDIVRINTEVSSSSWKAHQRTRGPVRMWVKTNRGEYYSGESIALTVNVKNDGSGRIVGLQAALMQKVVYYGKERTASLAGGPVSQHQTRAPLGSPLIARYYDWECISLLKGPGTGPRGHINWNDRILIPVDTVPNISNCKVISLSYILVVETKDTTSYSLSVVVPIVIGSRPFHEQASMCSTNANRSLASNSGSRPAQTEQLSTNTFHQFGTNQGSMLLERNYHPGSRNEFLRDQGEVTGSHTFQCSPRNPSSQRERFDTRDPPPPYTARSMSFSHFGSSVPQTPATNPEFQRQPTVIDTSNNANQTHNGNPDGACPPLNTGNNQEMRETAFAPAGDSVTNSDQPPPYDSLVTGMCA